MLRASCTAAHAKRSAAYRKASRNQQIPMNSTHTAALRRTNRASAADTGGVPVCAARAARVGRERVEAGRGRRGGQRCLRCYVMYAPAPWSPYAALTFMPMSSIKLVRQLPTRVPHAHSHTYAWQHTSHTLTATHVYGSSSTCMPFATPHLRGTASFQSSLCLLPLNVMRPYIMAWWAHGRGQASVMPTGCCAEHCSPRQARALTVTLNARKPALNSSIR